MFRLEVFLAVLFSGLLLSEIVENISRAALRMYRFSPATIKEQFQKNNLNMSSKLEHYSLEVGHQAQAVAAAVFFMLALLILYCLSLLNPDLHTLPPLQYIEREFNVFRKRVKVNWPEDWSAATTKTVNFTFDPSLREELAVAVSRGGEAIHCTEVNLFLALCASTLSPDSGLGKRRSGIDISGSHRRRLSVSSHLR